MLRLPEHESSLWREAYPSRPLYPELTDDMQVDVVVIGAGITGLTAAYLLKQSGKRVIVIDKDTVGGGTTGRTTGKVSAQHGLVYATLTRRFGKATAQAYGQANLAAVGQIERIITQARISCDWRREDSYVFTTQQDQLPVLRQEALAAEQVGLPASLLLTCPLPFKTVGAVRFIDQATFHSERYLLGLAKAIHSDGCAVFEHTAAVAIHDSKDGAAQIRTQKARISADAVIVATNVPTAPLMARGSYCAFEYPRESYIVAGRLPKPLAGMYISPDSHEYSILPVRHHKQDYLLIGGEGHLSGLRGNKQARYQRLAEYAATRFGITEITHKWSDRDYLSYDDIPLVGKLYPWSHKLYVATAFHKWGLTNGTVAAHILHDAIMDVDNPWADTFSSTRTSPITSIPHAIVSH